MLKSDRWIRKMAMEHDMINPFSEKQVREGVISYGLSSYGYDLRVADEFKIFTNVNCTVVDPKNFDERSFVTVRSEFASFRPTLSLWRARWSTSRFPASADHLRRQVHLRPLRHHRQRHALRAGVGRLRHSGNLQHHATARANLRQRRPVPDYFLPGDEVCEVSYADRKGKYQSQKGIVLPKL